MIDTGKLRALREQAEIAMRKVVEESLPSRFTYGLVPIPGCGQYWEVKLTVWAGDWSDHTFSCGCFFGAGSLSDPNVGINQFFENNDAVLEEFANAVESGSLNSLIPLLKAADSLSEEGASISIYSYVACRDEWMRNICDECVLIIHMSESGDEKLDVGCMQSERYRIRVPNENGSVNMKVPFDKVGMFTSAERIEPNSDTPYRIYEVALSFAGEDRAYVKRVAKALREMKLRVFYDEYENVTLWGKDLYVHLDEIYSKQAKYCVAFLSEHYKRKLWTNHERESAQARAFEERAEYILPVKLDETEIPGVRNTVGYIGKLPPKRLAELIFEKVRRGEI